MKDSVRYFRHAGVEVEHFLCCSEEVRAVERHAHEQYQFGLSSTDQAAYRYRGARHRVARQSLSVIHTGESHETYELDIIREPVHYRIMYVAPALLQTVVREMGAKAGSPPFFPDVILDDRQVVDLFSRFHRSLVKGSTLERDSALLDALQALISRFSRPRIPSLPVPSARTAARRARDYLDDHYSRNVSLAELANISGMSASHLSAVFRREFGVPPHQFQVQARIARAKRLLADGESPAEVAARTGFAQQSHFGRHFKRLVGVTPAQYGSCLSR